MTGLSALWLPILVSAVFVFVASSLIHMASPWHKSDYPKLSNEYIVASNPSLIVLADVRCCGQTPQTVAARPGWSDMSAVRNHAIVRIDDSIASRWGPRIVDFVRAVAAALRHVHATR